MMSMTRLVRGRSRTPPCKMPIEDASDVVQLCSEETQAARELFIDIVCDDAVVVVVVVIGIWGCSGGYVA